MQQNENTHLTKFGFSEEQTDIESVHFSIKNDHDEGNKKVLCCLDFLNIMCHATIQSLLLGLWIFIAVLFIIGLTVGTFLFITMLNIILMDKILKTNTDFFSTHGNNPEIVSVCFALAFIEILFFMLFLLGMTKVKENYGKIRRGERLSFLSNIPSIR